MKNCLHLLALLVPVLLRGAALPGDAAISKAELIYEQASYPQSHASTIVETSAGSLLAAWFGGTYESHPDVRIWLSRYENGRWTEGVPVADGIQHAAKRYPTWNPVLFQPNTGPLQLYYKVGPSPETWWGMVMTSVDDGRTWSKPRRLPEDILGPIKNKPVQLADGTLISPSSIEDPTRGWLVYIEISRDVGKTWERVGPLNTKEEFNAIQPSVLTYPDGRLQILCRSKEKVVTQTWSTDQGRTWSKMTSTGLNIPNSGSDAVTLADGRQLLVYNHKDGPESSDVRNWGTRWPLNVATSTDGVTWKLVATLEREPNRHGYAYPAVIQTRDGLVHITYTWNRERIKHVVLDPNKL
jgi:predicted neuraminidase